MSITFQDIKNKKNELDKKIAFREATLRGDAAKLMVAYRDSLSLPKAEWFCSDGRGRPYVESGYLMNGKFAPCSVSGFSLDEERRLKFMISTVVSDDGLHAGEYYLVSIGMWYEEKMLHVSVGGVPGSIIVACHDDTDSYFEVCTAMKDVVFRSFNDRRLD
ncbi:hypothetical protein [Entomohabitans teleogrylli]|uniref:hypothetical protein n=1 Tax=Entomohabitans teleogrylli TaxID=1384589 RepID=UPI00073D7055|nr:hypothetical protein [Entomohabitans teleogrylli]